MLNYVPIDAVVVFDVVTHDPDTGQIHDADTAPVFDVFEDTTDTPILSAQVTTKRTSKTGDYRGTYTMSAGAGFDVDKSYNTVVSATVTGSVSGTPITAKKVALTVRAGAAATTPGSVPSTVAGAVGSVTGNVGGNVVGSVGSVVGNVGGNVNGSVGSVTTVTSIVNGIFARAFGVAYLSFTFEQLIGAMVSALAGKLSGASTSTVTIRNLQDSGNVITATVDSDGNRTSVTVTP